MDSDTSVNKIEVGAVELHKDAKKLLRLPRLRDNIETPTTRRGIRLFMAGESQIARQFGASVKLSRGANSDRQLFLVRYDPSNASAPGRVKALGGKTVFGGSGWLLTEMAFSPAMSLEKAPGFRSVRGVSIDPRRLELFRGAIEGAISAKRIDPTE